MSDLFAPPPGAPVPLADQIASVRREIGMRARVYPAWVRNGKLKPDVAEHEQRAMQAVLETLERLAKLDAWIGDAKPNTQT